HRNSLDRPWSEAPSAAWLRSWRRWPHGGRKKRRKPNRWGPRRFAFGWHPLNRGWQLPYPFYARVQSRIEAWSEWSCRWNEMSWYEPDRRCPRPLGPSVQVG